MKIQRRNRDWVQDYFFLCIPKPLKDELLSSWLTRMAMEHKRSLSTFLSLYVRHEGSAISRTDMDFLYDEKLIDILALKSSLSKQEIMSMSLRSEEGHLFVCNDCLYPPKQIRKLVDKRTHHGLMYCPKCLAEDKIPYFRKQWRYTFYNICPKHKTFLTDRCWKCYERVNYTKNRHLKNLALCSKCEYDLRTTLSLSIPTHFSIGLDAVSWLEEGLNNGYFSIDGKKVKSVFIFEVYTKLVYLLERQHNLNLEGFPLLDEYKKLCRRLDKYASKKVSMVYKDFFLTAMVYYLFSDFPDNLIRFSKQNSLTHREFVHGFKDMPFWYKSKVDELIPIQNKIGREISEMEVVSTINFLKLKGNVVNQLNVANLLGCHSTIHKGFVTLYHQIKKS